MGPLSRTRRRRWLVDRHLQLGFAVRLLVTSAVVNGILAMLALAVNVRAYHQLQEFVRQQDITQFADELSDISRSLVVRVAVVFALGTVFQALFAIYASNRLAGPMLRLRQLLSELQGGNTTQRAAFRKRDRLGELAEVVNRRVQQADEAQNRLKAEIPFIASTLLALRSAIDSNQFPLPADELRRLESNLRTLAESWASSAKTPAPAP